VNYTPKSLYCIPSEQFVTITALPIAQPKSLTVSVLPVPAGPYGAPPLFKCIAVDKVI